MKISIIIPVYNAENLIQVPIDSLMKQTFGEFEVILINDGSTDNTVSKIENLIVNDKRFRLVEQKNSGPGEARNNGIKISSGDYIGFIDSDDYFDTTFLEKMYNKAIDECSDVIVCDTVKVNSENKILKEYKSNYIDSISGIEAFRDIMQSINITSLSQNKLFKKHLFNDVYYPANIIVNEDSATIYKLMLKAEKVSFVNEGLFYYVQHELSSMNSFNKRKLDDRLKVASLIKNDLTNKKLITTYNKEFIIYYLLNVILSGSLQVVKQSKNWKNDLNNFLQAIDKNYFSYSHIILLKKHHSKKMFALILLKINLNLFYKIANKIG